MFSIANPYASSISKSFKKSGLPEELLNDIDCMLVTDASGSLAVNIKDNVPLINLTTGTPLQKYQNSAHLPLILSDLQVL